jgi:hypothetical protein
MKQRELALPPKIKARVEKRLEEIKLQARSVEIEGLFDALRRPEDFAEARATLIVRCSKMQELLRETTKVLIDYQTSLRNSRPPFHAEYLLHLLLAKAEREAAIGDLVEEYHQIMRRFGKRYADVWFCKQVGFSIWPFVRRALARAAAFAWLSRVLRYLIS